MSVIIAVAFGGEFNNDWMAQKWTELAEVINDLFLQDVILGFIHKYLPFGTQKFWNLRQEVLDAIKKAIAHRRGKLKNLIRNFLFWKTHFL